MLIPSACVFIIVSDSPDWCRENIAHEGWNIAFSDDYMNTRIDTTQVYMDFGEGLDPDTVFCPLFTRAHPTIPTEWMTLIAIYFDRPCGLRHMICGWGFITKSLEGKLYL